jgi:hypothetical protein
VVEREAEVQVFAGLLIMLLVLSPVLATFALTVVHAAVNLRSSPNTEG